MKSLTVLVVFSAIGYILADTVLHPRGCIYINGRCHKECEVGTRSYTTGCGYLTPEATCEQPNPQPDESGKLCDFSACYCEPPTVRHPKTKKCVKLEDCSKQ